MDRRFFLTFLICSVLWIFFWEVRWKKGKESQIEEWLQGHRLSQYRHLFQGEWVIEIYLLNICQHCCLQPLVNGLIKSGASHWRSVYFSDLNKDTSEERLLFIGFSDHSFMQHCSQLFTGAPGIAIIFNWTTSNAKVLLVALTLVVFLCWTVRSRECVYICVCEHSGGF